MARAIRRSSKKPKPHRKGMQGKSTGMSMFKFVHYLFKLNEHDPPDGKKLTDEDIIESVQAEFSKKSITVRKFGQHGSNASVATHRARYNKDRPELLSLRYHDEGWPCRNYFHPVPITKIREKAWKYGIIDPRFFTLDEIKRVLVYREEQPEDFGEFRLPSKETLAEHPFGSCKFHESVEHVEPQSLTELQLHDHIR